ncbi:MAG: diguanylate cyclase [Campylobacterota bacterium]|nr:diguanylate cyclase [Campylobacterota bacterium]
MKSKNKVSVTLLIIMTFVFTLMIAIIAYDIKDTGVRGAHERAEAVANVVKIGLTSHMLNGTMANRSQFISQVEKLEQMKRVWIVRSPNVVTQYGDGMENEFVRDAIDRSVLSSGKMAIDYQDNLLGSTTYRVTMPYKAEQNGPINCLQCHDAKVGDTLGAISIEMDMNDLKLQGLSTVGYTALIALGMIVFIQIFFNRLIGPYMLIFESIRQVMRRADEGDYSQRVVTMENEDAQEVAGSINTLLEKLQSTMNVIEQKIHVFLSEQKVHEKDPLKEVKNTVSRLSDIYRFRKAIEHDERIDEVYSRFALVLREKFGLNDFNFIEADTTNNSTEVVHSEKEIFCDLTSGCRADRTNTVVDSCQFSDLCSKMNNKEVQYICVPYAVSNDMDFILSIITRSKEEAQKVRNMLPSIKDYVDAAKPEIVSKKLTLILEKSARTDALTGLYNRQYLEESIAMIVEQSKRTHISYGVLMADIDYFKMVNDTYGHDVGDEAIKIIAQTLQENVRESDMVVRFGGEEFIVLLYNCDSDYINAVAEKIREAFAKKKIRAGNTVITKTISIGAVVFPDQSENFWQCIKYADVALYEAKSTGRNRVVLFDRSMLKEGELEEEY